MTTLFSDDFETNDFSAWDTDNSGTAILISTDAALAGTYGCEIVSGCFGCGESVSQTFASDYPKFHFSFLADKNDLTLTSADFVGLIVVDTDAGEAMYIRVINDGGVFKYRAISVEDGGGTGVADYAVTVGVKEIEVILVRSSSAVASDGAIYMYVGGTLEDSATGLDNYNKLSNITNVTMLPELDGGDPSSGSMYIDDFSIDDTDTLVYGPFTGYDLVLGGGQP